VGDTCVPYDDDNDCGGATSGIPGETCCPMLDAPRFCPDEFHCVFPNTENPGCCWERGFFLDGGSIFL
jgi:hypothetical protein